MFMKPRYLIFLICFFASIYSFSQKVTYKDLLGIWDERYTELHPKRVLKFIDSIHLIVEEQSTKHKLDSLPIETKWEFNYTLNFFSTATVLQEDGIINDRPFKRSWIIRILGNDTLKMQSTQHLNNNFKWNDNETWLNTSIYIRRKEQLFTDETGKADTNEYFIKGKVYDSILKQGVPYASIKINNRNIGCTTNEKGNFELKLSKKFLKKNFKLIAFCVMYETTKVKIENKKFFANKDLIIFLRPSKIDVDKVVQTCCN